MKKFAFKAANVLCALAAVVAPVAGRACRVIFYEPKQPEGLADFIDKRNDK